MTCRHRRLRAALGTFLAFAPQDAIPGEEGVLLDCASTQKIDLERVVEFLAGQEVIFLGELHDSGTAHSFQLAVVEALVERGFDLVLSMEMFERDVQGVLDDYLKGRIDEETFLKSSRPWSNYEKHYRPIVERMRALGADVIAANVPRSLAAAASKAGPDGLPPSHDHALSMHDERDRYFERFREAMKDHVGNDGGEPILVRMFAAQCLKDDTMAESIDLYLRRHAHRRPLVVHLCGSFHSEMGLGTVSRLLKRQPTLRIGIVTTVRAEDGKTLDLNRLPGLAHFALEVPEEKKSEPSTSAAEVSADPVWQALFDGASLEGWADSGFGSGEPPFVEEGKIVLPMGAPLSGITFQGECPVIDYEVEVEATRTLGNDFFLGLTFPVRDSFCTLILGGWGGTLVGLSCIDGLDASSNGTRQYHSFKNGQSYKALVRVDEERITVLLDEHKLIDQPLAGHTFSLRPEVERSKPLGIASYNTRSTISRVRLRKCVAEEQTSAQGAR